ncbi:MAG: enoyl-CoA hydratase-related protein [Aeromicrobium sp.]
MTDDLLIETRDHVLTIRWNAPDRLNSLTGEMLHAAAAAIEDAGGDVRCVLITGSGRAFGAGAALGEDFDGAATLVGINRLVRAITSAPLPVVAGVNGLAAGASASLALSADLVVARRSAYFLLAFVNIGLMPDGGATELVAASIGRARAMQMAMLGQRLPAADAADTGLIHSVVDDVDFDAEVAALVERLAAGPTLALGRMKAAINASTLPTLDETLDRETEGQAVLFESHDATEGGRAFIEKRPAKFEGR